MSPTSDQHFTPLKADETPLGGSHAHFVSVGKNEPGKSHKSKIDFPNIFLVVAVLIFVGSFAYSLNTMRQNTTNTRASEQTGTTPPTNVLPVLTEQDKRLTASAQSFPQSFKGEAIPQSLLAEGKQKYSFAPADFQTEYVTNRVMLYYMFRDALETNGIPYEKKGQQLTFDFIESEIGELRKKLQSDLISSTDYALIKAYFNYPNATTNPQERYGENIQAVAKEKIDEYRQRMIDNPENIESLMDESANDEDLMILNNYEKGEVIKNYIEDFNDSPEQAPYVFDESFDTFLFAQAPSQVSEVFTVNEANPYMYVVVYPYRVDIKQYPSYKALGEEKIGLFTY